ncbi:MAG: hypothetical protein ABJI96_13870 [Paracoccaceae bacterium]
MGVTLSVVPLAGGCTDFSIDDWFNIQPAAQTSAAVTAEETALFERALSQGTVASAEQFLTTYPDSELVRSLLTRSTRTTLRGIDDKVVDDLSPSVVNSLPYDVKQALGIETERSGDAGGSNGYSG